MAGLASSYPHPGRHRFVQGALGIALALGGIAAASVRAAVPPPRQLDAEVTRAMADTGTRGLAVAVIDRGRVTYVRSYGVRNAAGDPLRTDTIMYGASLTKAVFADAVMQLAEAGLVDLDRPVADAFSRPLPDYPADDRYGPWPDLAGDPRWKQITPRMALTHSTGFANFAFLEPDGKLRIHFRPGSRFSYSGEGFILLQYMLEQGMGIDVGKLMQRRVFDRMGMRDTSMMWRADFAGRAADGWDRDGQVHPHDERSKVRAAGSMDTTITDMASFAAGYVRGEGLGRAGLAELLRPQLHIATAVQFPTLQPDLPRARQRRDLAAGLGVVVFEGPQGKAFFKGGHDDITGNMMVCVVKRQRCVVILANDVRAEAAFPRLVALVLGETGMPWRWEYGDMPFWQAPATR